MTAGRTGLSCCCVIIPLLLVLSQGCMLKNVIRIARTNDVKIIVSLRECTAEDKPRAIWMDRLGNAIDAVQEPLGDQTGQSRTTKAIVDKGPATVIIGTGLSWISLTIDTTISDLRQRFPPVPHLKADAVLEYPPLDDIQARRILFVVEHPTLSEDDATSDYPFESKPFIWNVKVRSSSGEVYKQTFGDSGFFYHVSTQDIAGKANAQSSEYSFVTPRKTDTGVITLTYTQETPDKLVQRTEIGLNVQYYPNNLNGPFTSGQLELAQTSGKAKESIKCYTLTNKCEVECFGLTGDAGSQLTVTAYKLHGTVEEELVSATQVDGEPVARVAFFPGPPKSNSYTGEFRCKATDSSGSTVSRDVSLSFYLYTQLDEDKSFAKINAQNEYEILCAIEGYPYAPAYSLALALDDGTEVAVPSAVSRQHWSLTEISGTIDTSQVAGTVVSAKCRRFRDNGSIRSTYTINLS